MHELLFLVTEQYLSNIILPFMYSARFLILFLNYTFLSLF